MPSLWLINQFANTPDLPGHTRHYDIAVGLNKRSWEVDVFASDFNLSERRFKRLKGIQLYLIENIFEIRWFWIRVFPYSKNDWKRSMNMLSFCIHIFITLFFKLQIEKPHNQKIDCILASSPQLPAAFICLLIAKLFKIPFVFEVRDLWPQVLIDQGGKSPKSLLVRLLAFMEKELYTNSNYVVVLASGSEPYVRRKGAKKVKWLPNGPNLNDFKLFQLPRENDGFNPGRPFRILYAGAHSDSNGLDNVIKAGLLLSKLPIQFIFIGDGPQKTTLIKQAAGLKNFKFLDPIPKSLMPENLANSDAILLSLKDVPVYKYGVSPNKLYDAYAIARPVITTVLGAVNSEVEMNNLGVTAPPGDPQSLAKSIEKLFKTPFKEREMMAMRARNLAENVYSREKVINSYDELLKEVIGK